MEKIGIIAEYNPFHNGHIYHLKKIKEKYPDSLLILVLNGYFLERGEISILSKEDKTKLSLEYGVDLVLELPFVFGTQSADVFAEKALEILNHFQINRIVFGSECNSASILMEEAQFQLTSAFSKQVKLLLKTGVNYPTALSLASESTRKIKEPNDLLGISYCKAILKNNYKIEVETIKRTNSYHDLQSNASIVSAKNIRTKLEKKEDISSFIPPRVFSYLQNIDKQLLWHLIQYKIITDPDLSLYLTVDEGIEMRLQKNVLKATNLTDFIFKVKTKRYTYNKINRMLIHILLGFTKKEHRDLTLDYIHVLGFNSKGQKYLSKIKKEIPLSFVPIKTSKVYAYELKAAYLYEQLTDSSALSFELQNKPIIYKENF